MEVRLVVVGAEDPAVEAVQFVQLLVRASECPTAEHFVVKSAACLHT